MRLPVLVFATIVGCSNTSPPPVDDRDASIDTASVVDAPAVTCPTADVIDNNTAAEVTVAGDIGSALGIFDPSIVYPSDASAGAMAYSSVPDQLSIRTRIAISVDHGASWTEVAEANAPEAATIPSSDAIECPNGACSGNLISEVSSLIFDADDPVPERRWKLFAHRYLVGPNVALHYRIGTIALQTANQPAGPWTAPQKLVGWSSPAPYTSTDVVVNATGLSSTADCLALTEPSALWIPGSLHLAVGCVYLDGSVPRIRVELLRSTDHARSWQSVTLVRPDDVACVTPGASVNAAELFAVDGTVYVAASPSDDAGYHGCVVFPLDLATGQIRRAPSGTALPSRIITTSPSRFVGACAFAPGSGGYVVPVAFLGTARPFRIFRSTIAQP